MHLFKIICLAVVNFWAWFSLAGMTDVSSNQYLITDATDKDYQKTARIILDYVQTNRVKIVYLGESHNNGDVQKAIIAAAQILSKEAGFDCFSLEFGSYDHSKPLYFALNQRIHSRQEWQLLYQSYFKYLCQLLDKRFGYNGKCYNEKFVMNMGNFLYDVAKSTSLKISGHEMQIVDFHNAIYSMKSEDPKDFHPYLGPNKWRTHFVLRNEAHAKNIVSNFNFNKCDKMIVLSGFGHLTADQDLRSQEVHPSNQPNLKDWPRVTPIHKEVSKAIDKKYSFFQISSTGYSRISNFDLSFLFED